MHASSAREAPYWGSGISTWFDKKPREHRAAFVIGSLEAAEEVSSSGARELFIRCSAPAILRQIIGGTRGSVRIWLMREDGEKRRLQQAEGLFRRKVPDV